MADEVTEKLAEIFKERLKVEEYLCRFVSSNYDTGIPIIIPNPYVDAENYERLMTRDDTTFKQEYLGEFVETEPDPKARHRQ